MGAAASVHGHEDGLDLAKAKALAGAFWSQEQWEAHAVDGVLPRSKFRDIISGSDPDFIWSLYDKDNSGSIQTKELSNLLTDLGLGDEDEDLNEALADMEIDDVDDNMDGKLEKDEFMRWLRTKKAELSSSSTGKSSDQKSSKPKHEGVKDKNVWGSDPAHHAAAVKIQAVARGANGRRALRSNKEEGEVEVISVGHEEEQNAAAMKIQAHARGRLTRKQDLEETVKAARLGTDL